MRPLGVIVAAMALAGCGGTPEEARQSDLDQLDRELATAVNTTDPAQDPALRAALRDQIMVDPALVQQANADAVRPPPEPASAQVPVEIARIPGAAEQDKLRPAPPASGDCPQCARARRALTLGALAQAQGGRAGACAGRVNYSAGWATRLPQSVPLYPDARVSEAAGADGQGCALRVVSFASAAPMQRLLDWYYTRTSAAGFAAQHGTDGDQHVLAGTKPGAAFLVILKARGDGGTDVDLMADAGA